MRGNKRNIVVWSVLVACAAVLWVHRVWHQHQIMQELTESAQELLELSKGPWHEPQPKTIFPGDDDFLGYWSFDGYENWERDQSKHAAASKGHGRAGPGGGLRGSGSGIAMLEGDSWFDLGMGPALNFAAKQDFTICGWKSGQWGDWAVLTMRNGRNPSTFIRVFAKEPTGKKRKETGELIVEMRDDDHPSAAPVTLSGVVERMSWTHFAVVRRGARVELFIAGKLVGSAEGPQASGAISTDERFLGNKTKINHWGGWVDEFYVFNRAVLAEQIADLGRVVLRFPDQPKGPGEGPAQTAP